MSPEDFGSRVIAETPAVDSNALLGRVINVSVSDLTGDKKKYHMKMEFRVNRVEGRKAYTEFSGFECMREFLSRFVRKRSQKIENVFRLRTKDGWELQVKMLSITLKKVNKNVQRRIRKLIQEHIVAHGSRANIEQFFNNIIKGRYQKESRSAANRIYPLRFNEVAKIEVLGAPQKK